MSLSKLALAALSFAVLAVPSSAVPPIFGSWKGKIHLNSEKIPGANDAKNKANFERQKAMVEATTITLVILKDHSFSMRVSGSPFPAQNGTKKGQWALKGDQLLLHADKSTMKPMPFTIAKNGKSFAMVIMNGMAGMKFVR